MSRQRDALAFPVKMLRLQGWSPAGGTESRWTQVQGLLGPPGSASCLLPGGGR